MFNNLVGIPTPSSISYMWNFGSTLGFCLMVQIVSGLFLTFHYVSFSDYAFSELVSMVMAESWWGWLVRFVHMNGASMFFFFVYLHLFRGLYFMSFNHIKVWMSGVTLLFLLMAISFLGYVLPWGQMSYWAVVVIMNLLTVIPLVGESLAYWIWGGFNVGSPTLIRFYSFHFILPFVLMVFSLIHLFFLHEGGSSNSLGLSSDIDKIYFHPFFTTKDLVWIFFSFSLIMGVSFYNSFLFGDAINFVPCNPMVTPVHIQPEWYFLSSYAILRCLPSKTLGVLALFFSIFMFFFFFLFKINFSVKFSKIRTLLFWFNFFSFCFLIKMGSVPAEEPWTFITQLISFFYFVSFIYYNI